MKYLEEKSFPNRFQSIQRLDEESARNYRQIDHDGRIEILRSKLIDLIDENLKPKIVQYLRESSKFGLSLSVPNKGTLLDFKDYYDELMARHAVKKDEYHKLDFAAAGITTSIVDQRFLNAKLTPFNLLLATYQLGEVPAIANYRFMYNPPSKSDGKYREWMVHFDNSNFAPEFKFITTRKADTIASNDEQCMAAFIYDTRSHIRFTEEEASTKFLLFDEIVEEIRNIPDSGYVVIRNCNGDLPLQSGIRTEQIPHHRSSSPNDETEARDSDLLTFHGVSRCRPFLNKSQLGEASGELSKLQAFVLGGFDKAFDSEVDSFLSLLREEENSINIEARELLNDERLVALRDVVVMHFNRNRLVPNQVFSNQQKAYDDLPEIRNRMPKLQSDSLSFREIFRKLIPMLANYDQNAKLTPDCSENKMFPARTFIRERSEAEFWKPLSEDLNKIHQSPNSEHLLEIEKLEMISYDLSRVYEFLESNYEPNSNEARLLQSCCKLSEDYPDQLRNRCYTAESHQVIILFLYYLASDLSILYGKWSYLDTPLSRISEKNRVALLQHLVSFRLRSDADLI